MNFSELNAKTVPQLKLLAKKLDVTDGGADDKSEVIMNIMRHVAKKEGYDYASGVLEVMNDSTHGVLRTEGLLQGEHDAYVSGTQIKKFRLKTGDLIAGPARPPKDNEKYRSLLRVDSVWGMDPLSIMDRPRFEKSTPIFPDKQIILETESDKLSTRIIDLLSPIGFGQRGMIVSPPTAGKTWLLLDIAAGVTANQ